MKIGILTFHTALNYGAVFQAYCLQEILTTLGHETYIINYRPKYLTTPYKTFNYNPTQYRSTPERIKALIRAFFAFPIRYKRKLEFDDFIKKHLKLASININSEQNDFDAFIFGSDQIWNHRITNGLDPVFMGDFKAAKNKIKVAYAASCGDVRFLSSAQIHELTSRLKHFKLVSTREYALKKLLDNNNIPNIVATDPVLLAGEKYLPKISEECNIPDNYILLFQLWRERKTKEIALEIAKTHRCKLVDISTMSESLKPNQDPNSIMIDHIHPGKLINIFQKANYIVTTSFHGTALSILFEKNFITVSVDEATDQRGLNLLKALNLEDRFVHNINDIPQNDVDYKSVNNIKENIIHESLNFLQNISDVFNPQIKF